MMLFDTIAAISTPQGKGGIAVIRVSGENALNICEKVFEVIHKDARTLSELPSRYMCRGRIWRIYGNERICIDDGMAVVFRAPASFTGEDVVEINCHGGALVTASVLSAIVEAVARGCSALRLRKLFNKFARAHRNIANVRMLLPRNLNDAEVFAVYDIIKINERISAYYPNSKYPR